MQILQQFTIPNLHQIYNYDQNYHKNNYISYDWSKSQTLCQSKICSLLNNFDASFKGSPFSLWISRIFLAETEFKYLM